MEKFLYIKNDKSRALFITGDDLSPLPSMYYQITVKLPPFGTHHTKMSFLKFERGMIIAVYSANLIQSDWEQRTQVPGLILTGRRAMPFA